VKTLVIDTATKACSVALYDGDRVVASAHEVIGRGHAERLLPLIAALPERGKADQIFVDVGPGSFTGIRVGVAAAKALGFAWSAPVHGYNGLELVAAMARMRLAQAIAVDVVMTGGHGEYFHQQFGANGEAPANPASITPDALQSVIIASVIAGDIAAQVNNTQHIDLLPDAACWHLIAAAAPLPPSPFYGRAPDAKLPQARAT
jgi:tRNA threonylcarbamoyladenosine biosynthesis protein TsaB